MKKTIQKIEEVFKASHLAGENRPEPVFSADWQSRLMLEVKCTAWSARTLRDNESPLNIFAFRLGWAMLCFAFVVSAVFFTVGKNSLNKTAEVGIKSSLWEIVDQNVNVYDVNLFDETGKAKEGAVK